MRTRFSKPEVCDDTHPPSHYSTLLEVTHSNLNANIIEDAYARVG